MEKFVRTMDTRCGVRHGGVDVRGRAHGAMNTELSRHMQNLKQVGDLKGIQNVMHVDCLRCVQRSTDALICAKLVPPSCAITMSEIEAAWQVLRKERQGASNQELMKVLSSAAQSSAPIHRFCRLVTRMWLMSPPESVVESMASVVEDVFGTHRQLDHSNAALELQVRWNGPTVFKANRIVESVLARNPHRFVRTSVDVTSFLEGTVIRKHLEGRADRVTCFSQ